MTLTQIDRFEFKYKWIVKLCIMLFKHVLYIKDVERRGGGGKLITYMNDLCIIGYMIDYNR